MARYAVFSSLAAGSIIVVAVAVLGSLTVLPATPGQARQPHRPPARASAVALVDARSRAPAVAGAAATGAAPPRPDARDLRRRDDAARAPALGLHLASDTARSLPSSITEVHTLNRLNAAFPSQQHLIRRRRHRTRRRGGRGARATDRTQPTAQRRRSLRDTHQQHRGARISRPHRAHASRSTPRSTPNPPRPVPTSSRCARPWCHAASRASPRRSGRSPVRPPTHVDIDKRLGDAIPWVIGFVVLLTLVIIGWVFRSVTLAVSTALINLLSAAAAFGVLTLTFQHTWANGCSTSTPPERLSTGFRCSRSRSCSDCRWTTTSS